MPTESNTASVATVRGSASPCTALPTPRAKIEKTIEPILRKCVREFADYNKNEVSDADFNKHTEGMFRPDVRRVSLIISMAQSLLGGFLSGDGLEVGSGYGFLLFPMALLLPQFRWLAVDHPGRKYEHLEAFTKSFRDYNCQFVASDIVQEPLPFPDAHFVVVTFSEVLEHLPPERLNFVLCELARVVRPGGILIMSSPNQASLENRLRLLKGRSILAMPDELYGKGVFGHIRLYTTAEMESAVCKLGFLVERSITESNNSGYRGTPGSFRRRLYRLYERLEGMLPMLRGLGDTWYLAFRKNAS